MIEFGGDDACELDFHGRIFHEPLPADRQLVSSSVGLHETLDSSAVKFGDTSGHLLDDLQLVPSSVELHETLESSAVKFGDTSGLLLVAHQ